MSEYFTDEELQAIVEGARARSRWYRDGEKDAILTPKGRYVALYYDIDEGIFILDAIRALPFLSEQVATLEAQNAALQAQLAEAKEEILCWEVNGEGPD